MALNRLVGWLGETNLNFNWLVGVGAMDGFKLVLNRGSQTGERLSLELNNFQEVLIATGKVGGLQS